MGISSCYGIQRDVKLILKKSYFTIPRPTQGDFCLISFRIPTGDLRRFIFMILGLGDGDPQDPTGRGARGGFEVTPPQSYTTNHLLSDRIISHAREDGTIALVDPSTRLLCFQIN